MVEYHGVWAAPGQKGHDGTDAGMELSDMKEKKDTEGSR